MLDASAGIAVALDRPEGRAIGRVLGSVQEVLAPSLYTFETANAVWKHQMAGGLDPVRAAAAFRAAQGLVDKFVDDEGVVASALVDAAKLGHPAYDLVYTALARQAGAYLCTLDQRLEVLAGELGVPVVKTAHWPSAGDQSAD
ncbi:MAG: type II toxin-antitoxin system VapC family toxin [Micrococcales bacterium]|nr:type II toxin-antitoxin system VapC family toxin [Micrococcales bacterium]